MPPAQRRFPYMVWARTESFLSPYSLSQSGMPAPDGAVLGEAPVDLSPPGADALPALRARLAELFDVDPARILVTPGASGAMLAAALHLFRPGTRVAAEVPSYEPLRALPELCGAELAPVPRPLEEGFALDPARVERALAGARTGHVFLTNPHNPSSAVLSAQRIRELADVAARAGGVLVSNEIYMELAQPERRVHAFALAPNALSLGSLTKAYGLGALRVGWIVAGEGLADRLAGLEDAGHLAWVDVPTPSLRLARRALDRLPELLRPLRRLEVESRPLLVDWLARSDAVEGPPPALGLAAFPRVRGVRDTRALAEYLAREVGVDVGPGEFFGAPGHVRVGWGVPQATLAEGLARLERGILAFRAAHGA